MDAQRIAALAGSAVTTFLLVTAAVIEVVFGTTGADVGPGIVGVTVGALAALAAVVAVAVGWSRLDPSARWAVTGYGAFGLTIVFLAGLSYVNVPGADAYLGLSVNLVIAAAVAVVVAVGGWQRSRGPTTG